MEIETWAANMLANAMAGKLEGGHINVFDADGKLLSRCPFAIPAFPDADAGSVKANPIPKAIAEADGIPAYFEAWTTADGRALVGSAGYKDDEPKPEMQFKTRKIIEGADVEIESFIFSVAGKIN